MVHGDGLGVAYEGLALGRKRVTFSRKGEILIIQN